MPQPVQTSFLFQAAICATAASALTGCATETSGLAVGAGVAVLSVGAWAGHRYLSRLRASASTPSASPSLLSPEGPAVQKNEPLRISSRRDVDRIEKLLHAPTSTAPELEEALNILCRQGLSHTDEDVAQASGAVLDTAIARRRELITHKLVSRLNEALENRTGEIGNIWCCQLLLQIARLKPEDSAARHAMDILTFVGIFHPTEPVAIKATSAVGALAESVSGNKAVSALIAPDTIERLITGGLQAGRGRFLARKALDSLKAVALFCVDKERAAQAFGALSTEGLLHEDTEIAVLAAERITEIVDQNHGLASMHPLVSIRMEALRRGAPRDLVLAFLETMAHIAAPVKSSPNSDRKVSEKALQILFDDALTHSDPDTAEIARRQLRAVYMRRPDLFSQDQRETLATSG